MSRWSSPSQILGAGMGSSNAVTARHDYQGHQARGFEGRTHDLVRCWMPSPAKSPELLQEEGLRHQLTAGQMAMSSVGGRVGTGLLLGAGVAMQIAWPAAILSFVAAACINFTVAMALGEWAS